jgi:RNase H-fold protein (predicted Holliday junction resolvase)
MRIAPDDQGAYLLAAVVVETAWIDEIRQVLRSLLYQRQERLHWRDEEAPRRTKIAEAIGGLDLAATVVIGTPLAKSKQERARRKCLEALLPNLEAMGVTRVVMEERTRSLVEADRKMLTAVRGKRLITNALRVETARPKEEPMLWLPDSVAGAFGAARDRGKPEWLELMRRVDQILVSTL